MGTSVTCGTCGELVRAPHRDNPPRVSVTFDVDELVAEIFATPSLPLRNRMLCALGIVDRDRQRAVVRELLQENMIDHAYVEKLLG